jgi:Na+-translocating ferredoxin:NAD+ oxidoreductase subunit C
VAVTFDRGVFLPHNKELTEHEPVITITLPEEIVIPLSQHVGVPCNPIVNVGEKVTIGQKIAESPAFISAPVHSSVSGTVTAIEPRSYFTGKRVNSVVIKPDMVQGVFPNKNNDLSKLSPEIMKEMIKEAGVVGMGGAAFPSHVKLSPPKEVDYVIINACECEPFLTCDHRMLLDMTESVIEGAKIIAKIVGAKEIIIGIETNKPDAAEVIKVLSSNEDNISVTMLDVKYPQGAEKQLIKATVNREVPPGKLPFEVGVVVHNVATCIAIFEAVKYEKPLYERVLTVTVDGIAKPSNVRALVGTPIGHIIHECGGFKGIGSEDVRIDTSDVRYPTYAPPEANAKVIMGGPMTGFAQESLDVPIVKGTGGILVFTPDMINEKDYLACVRCSRCVQHCPMGLYPNAIGTYAETGRYNHSIDWGALDCFECGVCVYVCPSNRPIVRFVREVKQHVAQNKD